MPERTPTSNPRPWTLHGEGASAPIDLAGCVLNDGTPGAFAEGDCDGDGIANGADEDPCGSGSPIDGGANVTDAGAVFDAGGVRADGGLDAQPTFGGGGGRRCHAAPVRGGDGLLGATLLLGLATARRRRR